MVNPIVFSLVSRWRNASRIANASHFGATLRQCADELEGALEGRPPWTADQPAPAVVIEPSEDRSRARLQERVGRLELAKAQLEAENRELKARIDDLEDLGREAAEARDRRE